MLTDQLARLRKDAIDIILASGGKLIGSPVRSYGLVNKYDTNYRLAGVRMGGLILQHSDSVSEIDVWHPWLTIPTDVLVDIATHGR